MLEKYSSRRQFLKYSKFSLLLLLNSCSNSFKKIKISFQSSFYPKSFRDTLPNSWQQENINFGKLNLEKNKTKLLNSDFTLINDGWLSSLDFENFQNLNYFLLNEKLDKRSKDFLNSFEEYQSNKLFPIGVIPYAVIIKNNKNLIYNAKQSWDFLLSEKLKGKIIFPKSPRIIMSIAQTMSEKNSLDKLKDQAILYEDQNSLNWLINTDASVAIVPYTLCEKYFRFDSRLSVVFPNKGVPLIWSFILSKSRINSEILIDWVESLEKQSVIDKLANQGWYFPFKNEYSQSKYNIETEKNYFGPSKICWANSWSLFPIDNRQKLDLENSWNQSLVP